jgi:hypothetical protein
MFPHSVAASLIELRYLFLAALVLLNRGADRVIAELFNEGCNSCGEVKRRRVIKIAAALM